MSMPVHVHQYVLKKNVLNVGLNEQLDKAGLFVFILPVRYIHLIFSINSLHVQRMILIFIMSLNYPWVGT